MKTILKNMLFLMGMALTMGSCFKDVIIPGTDPDGPPQAVSFNLDLAPLFKVNCGTDDGCHTQGDHKPFLDIPEQSYVNIKSGGFVNTVVPKESILYKQINGGMAEYIPSKAERQKVFDWIRNGAPNN